MQTNIAKGWKLISRGLVLLSLAAATQAVADPSGTTAGDAVAAYERLQSQNRSRSVQGLGSNHAFEQRNFRSTPADEARIKSTARVYLEDYQRVHQGVGKQYPTKPRVLGQSRRRGSS